MELFRDSKTKSRNLSTKSNHQTKNASAESHPRKCAEVFQCDRGGFKYVCLFCGEDFSKALQLEEHLLAHLINIVSTLDCKEHLSDIQKHGHLEGQCDGGTIGESFEVTPKLETTEINDDDFGVFIKTEPCVTEHLIEEDATIKETWFGEAIKCEHCVETFHCHGLKNVHRRQLHDISFPYDCQQCNASFNEEDKFKRHKELHGILSNPTCDHCQQIFEFQSDLDEHLKQTVDAANEIQNEPAVKRPHSCDLCGKTYSNRTTYKNHIKGNHLGERFYCDICPFKTKDRTNLITHMRVHTKERPYSCDICGKKFAQSSYIKIHKRMHTGEKPYQCNICGLTRYSLSKLNNHIKQKHLNLPQKVYPCTLCDKKCRRGSDLKNHMRTHTGQKPFKCAVCDTSFSTKKVLTQHKKLHELIKAYSCKYCGVKFAQSAGRRGHERRVHEGL